MSTPHKCPVCEGLKSMPLAFYDHNEPVAPSWCVPVVTDCRSCDGTGIVWHGERDTFKGVDYEQTTTMDGFEV